MPEYEMPIEEQLRILVKKFTSLEESLDGVFDRIDNRFDAVDGRLDTIDGRLDKVEGRLAKVDDRLDKIDDRLDTIDDHLETIDGHLEGVDSRLTRIEVRLDDTHAIAKMGLEAVDALRDSMNQKFAAMDKKQNQDIDLLKTVVVHVRKRVDAADSARRRRT